MPYIGVGLVWVVSGAGGLADADADGAGAGSASSLDDATAAVGSGLGGPPYIVRARLQSASAAGATAANARIAAREDRPIPPRSGDCTAAPQNGHAAPTRA